MRALGALLIVVALAAGLSGLGLALRGNQIASSNNQHIESLVQDVSALLLNGKTASAKDARKTAIEVRLLVRQQQFDNLQTQAQLRQQANGSMVIVRYVKDIESHLDRTIRRAVNGAALRVAREFGRQ